MNHILLFFGASVGNGQMISYRANDKKVQSATGGAG
jgi:hypothetical protein